MRSLHQLSAEKPHPVKDTLFTDNGPQYSSAEFAVFAKTWRFDHNISSPLYPPSNGKAEDAVKTVKRLFSKCKEAGRSAFQALLCWRNTPSLEWVPVQPSASWAGGERHFFQLLAHYYSRSMQLKKIPGH